MCLALLTVALLASAGARGGQDDATIPVKIFTKVKVGDWVAVSVRVHDGTKNRDFAPRFGTLSVSEVGKDKATVKAQWAKSNCEKGSESFELKGSLPLPAYTSLLNPETTSFEDIVIEHAKKKLGGRDFACVKASFTTKAGTERRENVLWLSTDVKGYGLVAWESKLAGDNPAWIRTIETVGFGSSGKTEWGKTAVEARAAGSDDGKRLPQNPYSDAKLGDWAAYAFESDADHARRGFATWKIVEKTDTTVTLDVKRTDGGGTANKRSTKEAPTIHDFLSYGDQDPFLTEMKVEDATYAIPGGKTLSCKKITVVETVDVVANAGVKAPPRGESVVVHRIWLSSDIKGSGFVSQEVSSDREAPADVKTVLVGYGSADKTEWGQTAEDAEKSYKAERGGTPK